MKTKITCHLHSGVPPHLVLFQVFIKKKRNEAKVSLSVAHGSLMQTDSASLLETISGSIDVQVNICYLMAVRTTVIMRTELSFKLTLVEIPSSHPQRDYEYWVKLHTVLPAEKNKDVGYSVRENYTPKQ